MAVIVRYKAFKALSCLLTGHQCDRADLPQLISKEQVESLEVRVQESSDMQLQ